jgi:uncharacterized membrane protein
VKAEAWPRPIYFGVLLLLGEAICVRELGSSSVATWERAASVASVAVFSLLLAVPVSRWSVLHGRIGTGRWRVLTFLPILVGVAAYRGGWPRAVLLFAGMWAGELETLSAVWRDQAGVRADAARL